MSEDSALRDLRMRQRELLADLGAVALRGTDIDGMLQEACRLVAEGLGVRFCKVLELVENGNRLLVRAAWVGAKVWSARSPSVQAMDRRPDTRSGAVNQSSRMILQWKTASGRHSYWLSTGSTER